MARTLCVLVLAGLTGCASLPNPTSRDPFEPFNRGVMKFNETLDAALLKPAAMAYKQAVPPLVRTGVSNFFGNMGDLWSAVNSALQFKFQDSVENFMRFNVNTFFGLGGILDVASELSIERHREDFGQTLGRWGVPAGPYLMLPLLGPSTLRDALALSIDRKGDLIYQFHQANEQFALYSLRILDVRSNLLRLGSMLDEVALDKYTFTRDAFLQKRRADIFGDADPEPDPGDARPGPDAGQPEAKPAR